MNILQIFPPHLSDVATLLWEIQQSHFQLIHILQIIYITSEENKYTSNCCSAALAVYLLLFSASYYLCSHSTASGACYRY